MIQTILETGLTSMLLFRCFSLDQQRSSPSFSQPSHWQSICQHHLYLEESSEFLSSNRLCQNDIGTAGVAIEDVLIGAP